jgi:subfamily B ATP-binding cassette protein MsbA
MSEEYSLREKADAVGEIASFAPVLTVTIIGLSFVTAVLEGISLGFILPILEQARRNASEDTSVYMEYFISAYAALGVPFTIEYIIVGVTLVMAVRFSLSFLVEWQSKRLKQEYVRHRRASAFDSVLGASVAHIDRQRDDDILNTIVTETQLAGNAIKRLVTIVEEGLLSLVYLGIALVLAPRLTVVAAVFLGGLTVVVRAVPASGDQVGEHVASANERVQSAAQAATQGIHEIKLFGLGQETRERFHAAAAEHSDSTTRRGRNKAAILNAQQLGTAVAIFLLIYGGLVYAGLSLSALGVFMFAMYRLLPRISTLNTQIYTLEADLPHLVTTQEFTRAFGDEAESSGDLTPPDMVEEIRFKDVSFEYEDDDAVLEDVSFNVERGEFVAFVGSSGAGKSTVVSLLTRLYTPDSGAVIADGTDVSEFDVMRWREHVTMVRQNPYIFNESLRYNVTLGNREASRAELERACEVANVTEFLDSLPEGYDTELGDDGVRLSGGQRQRIAIARALLRDAEWIVLDEATSDLDSALEDEVHRGIEDTTGKRGLIVIAHRLGTVLDADRIYTMEDGRIIEAGSHEELIDQDGTYFSLYASRAS